MLRKFYLNPTLDMETMTWSNDGVVFIDDSEIMLFKGDSTAKAAEQSQLSFDNTLQGIFQSQYANQTSVLNYLKAQMEPQITAGGVGIPASDLAAMRTSATDTTTAQYENARKAVAASENQSGLPSGVNAQISSSVLSQEAQAQAGAQNQITQANAAQKQANYWNSVNVLSGNAAQLNPLGYANASTAGTGQVAEASKANTYAQANSFTGQLGGAFASTLGKAAGVFAGGALFGG